jgi:hypothetical protein
MIAIALFAVAAVLGLTLAVRHFKGQPLPMPLALRHGLFAALGLAQLIFSGPQGEYSPLWKVALGVFLAAALGGFTLFGLQLRKGKLSTPLVIGHALGAAIAFTLLLLSVFNR